MKRIFPAIALASLIFSANLAMATEVVLVAVAPATSDPATASATQKLEALTVLSSYDAIMRSELARVARYPNHPEARRKQLQGKVAVEFEIDRKGNLMGSEIVQSSSARLDAAALAAVSRAQYPALPDDFLPGAASQRYQVTFDYRFVPQK